MNIFEYVTRNARRFPSSKGDLTVEQVWTLPLTSTNGASLDDVAVKISDLIEDRPKKSFVNSNRTEADNSLQICLDVVKHIIAVKEEENAAKQNKAAVASERARLEELVNRKKDQALDDLPIEELQRRLDALKP